MGRGPICCGFGGIIGRGPEPFGCTGRFAPDGVIPPILLVPAFIFIIPFGGIILEGLVLHLTAMGLTVAAFSKCSVVLYAKNTNFEYMESPFTPQRMSFQILTLE